jgi:biopolymer transport protein ExbB
MADAVFKRIIGMKLSSLLKRSAGAGSSAHVAARPTIAPVLAHFFFALFLFALCFFAQTQMLPAQQSDNFDEANVVPVTVQDGRPNATKTTVETESTDIWKRSMETIVSLRSYIMWAFVTAFFSASIIAVWFAIERLVVLRKGRVIPRPFVERFLQHLNQRKLEGQQALKLCEENGSPIAIIFAHGVRKWGKPSVEVEQAIIDGGERQVSQLRKHLRVLNGVATVTPLIGLLGTVIGMIISFNDIATSNAMGNPQQLANGIAMALFTTAIGLTIAIPTLITYTYLAGRIDSLVMEMDLLSQDVVNFISAEGLANPSLAMTQPRSRRSPKPHAAASK